MDADGAVTHYVDYLPAALRQGKFIKPFLLSFERILTGLPPEPPPGVTPGADLPPGIEQVLDAIHSYFTPADAPDDFVPWLAGWVSLALRDDLDLATQRAFIGEIVPLYRERGTRQGLEKYLNLYLGHYGGSVVVIDHDDDASPPRFSASTPVHFFRVIVNVPGTDPATLAITTRVAQAIIEQEKPVHTYYGMDINFIAMRLNDDPKSDTTLGPGILVGVNTIFGNYLV